MSASPRSLPVFGAVCWPYFMFYFIGLHLFYRMFAILVVFFTVFYSIYWAQPVRLPFVVVSHYMSFLLCSIFHSA